MTARLLMLVAALVACGQEDQQIDCANGMVVRVGEDVYCLYAAAPDTTCPDGAAHQLYIQSDTPGWTLICTNHEPNVGGTLELPPVVCSTAGARRDCVAAQAIDGGLCCSYSEQCTAGGHGGWAPRMALCPLVWGYDGAFRPRTDAWGCAYLEPLGTCIGGEMCCLE
jgi:hypothetical protein